MSLKRTTVYADEQDLAVIKAAAVREGVSEAEILREAIHLAAMAKRQWDEPFFSRTYVPTEPAERGSCDDVWDEKVHAYRRSRGDAT